MTLVSGLGSDDDRTDDGTDEALGRRKNAARKRDDGSDGDGLMTGPVLMQRVLPAVLHA